MANEESKESTNESKEWRRFLQPLITALCTLLAAAALTLQRADNNKTDTRLTALEVQNENMQPWRHRVDGEIYNFRAMLSDIRSDVSFIRGKLENVKGK